MDERWSLLDEQYLTEVHRIWHSSRPTPELVEPGCGDGESAVAAGSSYVAVRQVRAWPESWDRNERDEDLRR
jgi:hypothetical protein